MSLSLSLSLYIYIYIYVSHNRNVNEYMMIHTIIHELMPPRAYARTGSGLYLPPATRMYMARRHPTCHFRKRATLHDIT